MRSELAADVLAQFYPPNFQPLFRFPTHGNSAEAMTARYRCLASNSSV